MRVLLIGQLPKELGGNYTTGAANVVYELSKQKVDGIELYTFGTNMTAKIARCVSQYKNQYIGYSFRFISLFCSIICRPFSLIKRIRHYIKTDHQNPFRYLFYEDNIARAIRAVNPDVIHVHSIQNLSPVHFALDNRRVPILLTCHGIFYRGEASDMIGRDIYLGNIKLADAYTGLTKESVKEYNTFLGIEESRVIVIPNGVDCNKFCYSIEKRENIRAKYQVTNTCKVFITVASIQERKGQLDFIKLLTKLDIEWQYWIIGRGPDESIIREYVAFNNIEDKVKFLGYRNSAILSEYYSAADFYAHPSWKEGQALSELEANATGLRTIVNKAIEGTIASDLSSQDYYVVDFNDINPSDLIRWITKEQNNRQSKKNFDWCVISAMYAKVYNEISK